MLIIIIIIVIILFRINYKKAYNKASKEVSKVDMKNWNKYCRELPGNYSPAIVSVLCNFEEELYKDLPAIVLNLCANGYLDIIEKDGGYEYIDRNKDSSELMENERYVLDYILHRTDEPFDNKKWSKIVIKDAQKLSLIEENDMKSIEKRAKKMTIRKLVKPFVVMFAVVMIITTIGIITIKSLSNIINKMEVEDLATQEKILELRESYHELENIDLGKIYFSALIIFLVILCISGIPIVIISLAVGVLPETLQLGSNKYKYIRTEKGEEDYKNWIAFKNFLEDYSYINQRNIQEVYLWEYYLAYATSLGIAEKVLFTSNKQILHNKAFDISNYSNFIESVEKTKKNF